MAIPDVLLAAIRHLNRTPRRFLVNTGGFSLVIGLMIIVSALLWAEHAQKERWLKTLGNSFITYVPTAYQVKNLLADFKMPTDFLNEGFFVEPSQTRLLPLRFVDQLRNIPGVDAVVPFLVFRFRDPRDSLLTTIGGFDPASQAAAEGGGCLDKDLVSGTILRKGDQGVVLVEENFAADRRLKVGSLVNVAGIMFPVLGIIKANVRPVDADIYLPFADAEKVINRKLSEPLASEANVFFVRITDPQQLSQVVEATKKSISACQTDSFEAYLPAVQALGLSRRTTTLLLGMIAAAVLLFSIRSQTTSVLERSRDIGILKAIGWRDAVISQQIFCESMLQSFIGAIYGGLLGLFLVIKINFSAYLGAPVVLDGSVQLYLFGGSLCLSLLGGCIAGYLPALSIHGMTATTFLKKH